MKQMSITDEFRDELRRMIADVALAKIAYRIPEAGAVMGVSERTVYRLIEQGEISTCKVNGVTVVSDATLRDYIRRHETTKTKAMA